MATQPLPIPPSADPCPNDRLRLVDGRHGQPGASGPAFDGSLASYQRFIKTVLDCAHDEFDRRNRWRLDEHAEEACCRMLESEDQRVESRGIRMLLVLYRQHTAVMELRMKFATACLREMTLLEIAKLQSGQ